MEGLEKAFASRIPAHRKGRDEPGTRQEEIVAGVEKKFGARLEREPVVLG